MRANIEFSARTAVARGDFGDKMRNTIPRLEAWESLVSSMLLRYNDCRFQNITILLQGALRMLRVYLDVCCLNRPFDDQSQARIRLESEAVLIILARCEAGEWELIGSEAINLEISQTPDPERRRRVQAVAVNVQTTVLVEKAEVERAQQFEVQGISAFDALHLACAESGSADIFLTTDDQLVRKSATLTADCDLRVENPLAWLREVS